MIKPQQLIRSTVMDEVVVDAKAVVENAIQHKISTLDLAELHKQNNLLSQGDKK